MVRVGQPTMHAPPCDEPGTGDRGFCAQIARPERGLGTGDQVGARRPRGGSRRGPCLALGKVPADIFLLKTKPMPLFLI